MQDKTAGDAGSFLLQDILGYRKKKTIIPNNFSFVTNSNKGN